MLPDRPEVQIIGYFYVIDLGAEIQPSFHHVGKNAACTCALAEKCPAVSVVKAYLAAGGARAPEPRPGFYPVIPHHCPICGAAVYADHQLGSPRRGIGWRCVEGGAGHYWQRMGQHLAQAFQRKQSGQSAAAAAGD